MTGIHSLQHVQRGFIADLADDNPVGAHTQCIDHQGGMLLAAAFDVGRACSRITTCPAELHSARFQS